ncbi:MAG: putative SAM-dependent methyltransferase [Acidobacteriales bacterium]|nr:putative SAM-dependent methyltransferase [Terriglobales bacterium]
MRFEQLDRCPVCESPEHAAKFTLPDYLYAVPGTFEYVTCAGCATVYQNPRVALEDLEQCYPSNYFTHFAPGAAAPDGPHDAGRWTGTLRKAIRRYADGTSADDISAFAKFSGAILAWIPGAARWARYGVRDPLAASGNGGRCLEVGPGAGNTLRRLHWIGWEAFGLDVDAAAAATAQAATGCDVKVGTLTGVDFPDGYFELIFMSHVLEHLPDLRASMERCFRLLEPGGRLVVVYPNPESLGIRGTQQFSVNWDPPRHLVLPPMNAAINLLKSVGFQDFETRTSAGSAAGYRKIGRQYRAGRTGKGFENTKPSIGDRAFALYETVLVMFGAPVGEEIRITAWKPMN